MYIYGKNVAREKLSGNEEILKAYVSKKFKDQLLIDELKKRQIKIQFVDDKILNQKVDGLHQGIVLEVEEVKTYSLDDLFVKVKNKKNPD